MRLKKLILGDMRFQYKYGFYAVYLILVILYSCILFALPEGWREKAADIMILTDPAAMGLFFMGSIIFTMLGLWIAMKVKTLNSFMVCTVPIEIIFFVPSILYLFGIQSKWMLLLPACAIMHMYMGYDSYFFLCLLICVVWAVLILYVVNKTFAKVVRNMGGMKL